MKEPPYSGCVFASTRRVVFGVERGVSDGARPPLPGVAGHEAVSPEQLLGLVDVAPAWP